MLIASGLIVFLLVTQSKVETVIPRTQLAIDLITLDSIQRERIENSNDDLKALIDYVNGDKFSKLQTGSIFSKKYNNKKERDSRKSWLEKKWKYNHSNEINNNDFIPYNQLCFLSDNNDNLRSYWQEKINPETRVFVEYDRYSRYEDDRILMPYKCTLLKELSNKEDDELLEKSGFNQLVQKIRNNQLEEVISPMLKYVPPGNINDIRKLNKYINKDMPDYVAQNRKLPVLLEASVVQRFAGNLYQKFYDPANFKQDILFLCYLLVNLISLLLLLFNNTYLWDFIFALVYIFLIVGGLWFAAAFSSSSLSSKTAMLVFIFLPTIIVSCLALSKIKIKNSWRFKVLNLVAFPFAVVISVFSIIVLMKMNNIFHMNNERVSTSSLLLAFLSYIPFVPFLKKELLRQLNLPKD